MNSLNRRFGGSSRAALALVLVMTLLAGLATVVGQASAQDIQTRVRFLHASSDLGQIEVALNGEGELDEFEYGTTSDWIEVEPGLVRVTITEDRAGFNWAVFDTSYPIAAGGHYNFIISDVLILATPITRDPLPADTARVQVVHAAVDVPSIDVAVTGGDTIISNLAYGKRSPEVVVPAGTRDFEVRLAGSPDVALSLPGTVLEAGMVYEFVAMGTLGSEDTPLTVTPLVDDVLAGTPTASPAASPVASPVT
jgi:hypothetical protein